MKELYHHRQEKKSIGKLLLNSRIKSKMSRFQICKEAALTYQQLQHIEAGTSSYTIDSLIRLCDVVGLSVKIG